MNQTRDQLARALEERYRVDREIGAGGMATVFLAMDLKHRRPVAVKVLHPDLAATLGAERFLREVEIAARLQHPHILPLYDSGSAGGLLYYVMPFVEGPSLRDRLSSGALPIDEGIRVIRELADALSYAHAQGVVHRDIKPGNVLLSGGHALVMDFGVARAVSASTEGATLTSTGLAVGTAAYMAPEQATADPALDHRADIYALGVVAWEVFAGLPPFSGSSPQHVIAQHLTQPAPSLRAQRPAVSEALEAIVLRCLAKGAADRWQHASDVVRALDALQSTDQMPAAVRAASPRRRRRTLTIIAAVALAVAAAGAMWFVREGRAGTLIGDDVLATNDLVLVAEFTNRTSDSSLAATVTDAVRADLQQSRVVRIMSQAATWAGLRRMGLPPGGQVPNDRIQELAEREGASAYVVGDVSRLGDGYRIAARVVATNGGSEVLTADATNDAAGLIDAVQEIGHELRRGIGESLRSVVAAPALSEVTTASLPALRAHSAGVRAGHNGDFNQAIVLLKEAIALDSGFASAWSALASNYGNSGQLRLATEATRQAYRLRERMSEYERLRIEAQHAASVDDVAAEEAARSRLASMGRDLANYADMFLQLGRLQEAESMARRSVAAQDRSSIAYWNLAEAQAAQQKWAAADSTAAGVATAFPSNAYQYFISLALLEARREFDSAAAMIDTLTGKIPETARHRCLADLNRGRRRAWQHCPTDNPMIEVAAFRLSGDTARARRALAPFLTAVPEQRDMDAYAWTIVLLTELDRDKEARSFLDEWRRRAGATDPGFRSDSAIAVGAVLAAEEKWDEAVQAFLALQRTRMRTAAHFYNRGLPEAAAILRRQGKPDSAIVLLERAIATPGLALGAAYDATWYSQGLKMLGEMYEARGDRAKAASYYATYVDLLREADPPLAASVAQVRARLARLGGDAGRR